MTTVLDMITGEIQKLVDRAGLAMVSAPKYSNTGVLHAIRGVEPVLAVEYQVNASHSTFSLSGPAVEQAPFEFLAAQHKPAQQPSLPGHNPGRRSPRKAHQGTGN